MSCGFHPPLCYPNIIHSKFAQTRIVHSARMMPVVKSSKSWEPITESSFFSSQPFDSEPNSSGHSSTSSGIPSISESNSGDVVVLTFIHASVSVHTREYTPQSQEIQRSLCLCVIVCVPMAAQITCTFSKSGVDDVNRRNSKVVCRYMVIVNPVDHVEIEV